MRLPWKGSVISYGSAKLYPMVHFLFKISIFFSTFYTVFKSGYEYTCLGSRPGTVYNIATGTGVTNISYQVNGGAYFTPSCNSEDEYNHYDKSSKTYIRLNLKCEKFPLSSGERMFLNFKGLTIDKSKGPENSTYRYEVLASVLSEDCTISPAKVNLFFFLYMLITMPLMLLSTTLLVWDGLKRFNSFTVATTELLVDLYRFTGVKLHHTSGFCYLKTNKRYRGNEVSRVMAVCVNFPGKQTIGSNTYNDFDKIYTLSNSKLLVRTVDGLYEGEIILDFEEQQLVNLSDVFWNYENKGYPAVMLDHCLRLQDIVNIISMGSYFKTEIRYSDFYNSSFDVQLLGKLYSVNDTNLVTALVRHNELFFHETNGNISCLNMAVSRNLRFHNRPDSCNNSRWKYYCSDVAYVHSKFGIYIRGIEARKPSSSVEGCLAPIQYNSNLLVELNESEVKFTYRNSDRVIHLNDANIGSNTVVCTHKAKKEEVEADRILSLIQPEENTLREKIRPELLNNDELMKSVDKVIHTMVSDNIKLIDAVSELRSQLPTIEEPRVDHIIKNIEEEIKKLPFNFKGDGPAAWVKMAKTINGLSKIKGFKQRSTLKDCLEDCKGADRKRALSVLAGNDDTPYETILNSSEILSKILGMSLQCVQKGEDHKRLEADSNSEKCKEIKGKLAVLRGDIMDLADNPFCKKVNQLLYSLKNKKITRTFAPPSDCKQAKIEINCKTLNQLATSCATRLITKKLQKMRRGRRYSGTVKDKPQYNNRKDPSTLQKVEEKRIELTKQGKSGFVADKLLADFAIKNKVRIKSIFPPDRYTFKKKTRPFKLGEGSDSLSSLSFSIYLAKKNIMPGQKACQTMSPGSFFSKELRYWLSKKLKVGLLDNFGSVTKDCFKDEHKPRGKNINRGNEAGSELRYELIMQAVLKEFYQGEKGRTKMTILECL